MMPMNNIEQFLESIAKTSSFISDDRLSTIISSDGELEETELDLVSAASDSSKSYADFLRRIRDKKENNSRAILSFE